MVDVEFPSGSLPTPNEAIYFEEGTHQIVAEMQAHLTPVAVRSIALESTMGLKRGVRATDGPLTMPVGDAVLGRLLDVQGNIGDTGATTS